MIPARAAVAGNTRSAVAKRRENQAGDMGDLRESQHIRGVMAVNLQTAADERGQFTEVFRREWFPGQSWEAVQLNRSESRAGVLRGLHFHRRQVDYWHCVSGHIRAGLYDLRQTSPTRGHGQMLDLEGDRTAGLFIPAGVAHGFVAVTDVVLMYVVDQYYDGGDEFGLAWNDPALGLEWQAPSSPTVSPRDVANPRLADLDEKTLPD